MSSLSKTQIRLQFVVALFGLCAFALLGVPRVEAVQANMVRIQLVDYHSCTATLGTARGNPAGDNIWSLWASDYDGWDADCARLFIDDTVPAGTDFQVCIETQDDSIDSGDIECTPWATEGGGWSEWAADPDKWAYDALHIKVNTRTSTMAGRYVSNYRLGIQNSRAAYDDCAQGKGTSAYTPYMIPNGGWGGWAPDGLRPDGDPEGSNACVRINLDDVTIATYPSVSSLSIAVNGVNQGNPGSITIGANDTMSLTWSGTNSPTSCTGTNFSTGGAPGGTVAVAGPAKGAQTTYTVSCTNAGGGTPANITVTRNPDAPVTTASVSINGGAYTSPGSTVNVNPSDTISIRWSAPGATSCSKSAGAADFIVSNTTGPDSVAPPSAGATTPYSVVCTNAGGPGPVSNVISIRTNLPCGIYPSGSTNPYYRVPTVPYGYSCSGNDSSGVPYSVSLTCNNGTLSPAQGAYTYTSCSTDSSQQPLVFTANGFSTTTSVRSGSFVRLSWNSVNSSNCTVSGIGGFVSTSTQILPTSTAVGSSWVQINTKSVFTLRCIVPGPKEVKATVTIIPEHIEI
jgi:hypothetical protein